MVSASEPRVLQRGSSWLPGFIIAEVAKSVSSAYCKDFTAFDLPALNGSYCNRPFRWCAIWKAEWRSDPRIHGRRLVGLKEGSRNDLQRVLIVCNLQKEIHLISKDLNRLRNLLNTVQKHFTWDDTTCQTGAVLRDGSKNLKSKYLSATSYRQKVETLIPPLKGTHRYPSKYSIDWGSDMDDSDAQWWE